MTWEIVYRQVKRIPRGRVTTYGEIARATKIRGGARVVGYAMAATPRGRGIPWHRVVGAGGKLIIREPYGSLQRKLLESEGVEIGGPQKNNKRSGWKPKRANPQNPRGPRIMAGAGQPVFWRAS